MTGLSSVLVYLYYFGRALLKRVFEHMKTAKAQIRLQSLHCPLTEPLDTTNASQKHAYVILIP